MAYESINGIGFPIAFHTILLGNILNVKLESCDTIGTVFIERPEDP